ncbi:hypothetical protein KSS87_006784 [Heliosperma pusillum]|nr:hypothetical protein KSS87_006784 [Heliosperma pusillum]
MDELSMPTLPDNQIGQLNVTISRTDSSVSNTLDGFTQLTNGYPCQFPSSAQYNFVGSYPILHGPVEQKRSMSFNINEQLEPVLKSVNQPHRTEPIQEAAQKQGLQLNSSHQVSALPYKRKVINERTEDNRGYQKMLASNKRVTQVGPYTASPSALQVSAPKKNSSKAGSGRKVVHIEPVINDSRSNATKKILHPQGPLKGQTESHDSVRAKLRESLASALALVSQEKEGYPDEMIKIDNEAIASTREGIREHKSLDCPLSNAAAPLEFPNDGQSHVSSIPSSTVGCTVDDKTSLSFQSKDIFGEASQTESFLGTDFQCNSVLPGDDSLFSSSMYFKDDFLQGNGLSWESDLSLTIPKVKETENDIKTEPMNVDLASELSRKLFESPESVALAIESELFKLFGAINKKYKEKGRSLLFNLKDRNNPELRERVMSGKLPPDRLCSMTAEELASKELSEWRIAKAEELDNMKVLPETDVNMRRLVKKTHKGEYQVDFEHDVGTLEEIPSIAPLKRLKLGVEAPKVEKKKADECEITLPSDGADMQGLMSDELNDLPPVISLDEFMESLNKDPPFENIQVDSKASKSESDKENAELGSKILTRIESPKSLVKKISPEKVECNKESPKTDGNKRVTGTLKLVDPKSAIQPLKGDCVWEGELQLSLSSAAYFMAFYKSGEKGSSGEWASFFDIKGRVKYDAFDKFLQALPMSRSRAIMVCHFVLKEGCTDTERASLKELVDSYIADERVGFAEPGNGVELYLCTPRSKTVDMIVNHLPKSYTDKLNDIDDGLIGIVVWRKKQITSSAISPISSKPQPVTKKQISGQYVDNDMNRNNVFAAEQASPPPIFSKSKLVSEDEDDDDAPPGFGPPGPREDDDLPEFQFSDGSHPSGSSLHNPSIPGRGMDFQHYPRPPPLQVEQMRELIQKYGQNGNNTSNSGIPTEPWNDDDDDIPEWQPQQVHNPVFPIHTTKHDPVMANHQVLQRPPWAPVGQMVQPLQPPMNVQHQRAWGRYGPESVVDLPSGQFYGSPGPSSGYPVRDLRSDTYKSRK